MELLVGAGLLQRYSGYLGGYERSLLRCVHQWRPSVRCLWLHRLGAGHSDDRRFNGGDGFDVSPPEQLFKRRKFTKFLVLPLLERSIIGLPSTLPLEHELSLAGCKAGSHSVAGRQLSPLLLS
jgi:hypothetical protein